MTTTDLFHSFCVLLMIRLKLKAVLSDTLSWQRWSDPSRRGARSHGRTRRASWGCRFHCPRTRYRPESRLLPSDRPEDHQSRPERTTNKQTNRQKTTQSQYQHFYICFTSAPPTMQEEAPEAPAQIIRSLILLPQYRRHWSLVSRGRAACCSRAGVSGAATQKHITLQTSLINIYSDTLSCRSACCVLSLVVQVFHVSCV